MNVIYVISYRLISSQGTDYAQDWEYLFNYNSITEVKSEILKWIEQDKRHMEQFEYQIYTYTPSNTLNFPKDNNSNNSISNDLRIITI